MAPDYVTLLIFIILSLLFPASLILFSKLIRLRTDQNQVAKLNYESSEETIGSRFTIMKEYFHYFSAFLAFEVVSAILLVWAAITNLLTATVNIAFILFAIFALILEAFAMLLAKYG